MRIAAHAELADTFSSIRRSSKKRKRTKKIQGNGSTCRYYYTRQTIAIKPTLTQIWCACAMFFSLLREKCTVSRSHSLGVSTSLQELKAPGPTHWMQQKLQASPWVVSSFYCRGAPARKMAGLGRGWFTDCNRRGSLFSCSFRIFS